MAGVKTAEREHTDEYNDIAAKRIARAAGLDRDQDRDRQALT
ncbi:Protein of unknown function [Lactobacillus equicursoris 66c]|uniref:Uncharacterized protein n=1 Tax=Lactobacillus equicursoris 66c TaxID=872326 RepID=K0NHC6_9LACO|nr:Protein of unknown function [Lactobacillus equicursoris 66c]